MKSYQDIRGDGGSDVLAQVEAQRRAVHSSLADVRHLVAVASGKGGVGKSTVTVSLARALRGQGHAVGSAAAFVLVTIPSEISRGVVARSVSALEDNAARVLGYIENMVGYCCRHCGEVRPLFPESTTRLPIPRLGAIPFDPELAALCDRGGSDPRDLESLRAVDAIRRRITRILESPS